MQLAWQPVAAATGDVTAGALAGLFAAYGAPLVLKCDNGSAFTGTAVRELLAAHGVELLVSPPYWPRYNGSVEAGIGSLKDRTEAHAGRLGHAGYWTWDDTAAALAEANTLARPGRARPTPGRREHRSSTPSGRRSRPPWPPGGGPALAGRSRTG